MKKDTQYYARIAKRALNKLITESSGKNPNATPAEMRNWNLDDNTPAYTKAEYRKSESVTAKDLLSWNKFGNTPKFTKDEHMRAPKSGALERKLWNKSPNTPKYTYEEIHSQTIYPNHGK